MSANVPTVSTPRATPLELIEDLEDGVNDADIVLGQKLPHSLAHKKMSEEAKSAIHRARARLDAYRAAVAIMRTTLID